MSDVIPSELESVLHSRAVLRQLASAGARVDGSGGGPTAGDLTGMIRGAVSAGAVVDANVGGYSRPANGQFPWAE